MNKEMDIIDKIITSDFGFWFFTICALAFILYGIFIEHGSLIYTLLIALGVYWGKSIWYKGD